MPPLAQKPEFWGVEPWGPYFVYTLMAVASIIMLVRFFFQARLWWQVGRAERRWNKPLLRLWRTIRYAIFQTKVLGQLYPGIMHVAIAWSFFVFFLGTALGTINGHFFRFLVGTPYLLYKLALDGFALLFFVGAIMAGYRRFIQKPERLTQAPRFTWTLILLAFIVLNGLIVESVRLAIQKPDFALWSPVGWGIAQIWIAAIPTQAGLTTLFTVVYIIHPVIVALFFVVLPSTPLIHIFTAPMNVFFSRLDTPVGKLAPVAEKEPGVPLYTQRLTDMTWSQLLNGDTCTECGRCQDACPAYASGTPLSPKKLILGMRDALRKDGPALKIKKDDARLVPGDVIAEDVIWACTSCGACVRECPVLIEHVDAIVDMRRYLVSEGRMDSMLQDALANLGRYGNSFGQSARNRAKWAKEFEQPIPDARKEPVDYLWFVGDYASFSPALTEITAATARIFQKAGLNFGILYEGEFNAGNDARRVGEEGLFEFLVEKNQAAFEKSDFKTFITTDPHSYNTLKHEYPQDAIGNRQVLHYTEILDQLITSGKLKLTKKLGYKVTYHDPCYLGRYNEIYDAPRRVIEATGCEIVEMPRCKASSLCCGAGGGRIWMEEGKMKERPSEMRVREAVALPDVSVFVVTCPKDVTMYRDAVKTTSLEDKMIIKDLIELVYEAL
jgi:Fe-S oxidoreductase/nitrate reductase gamma subunit